ncbi:MAG: recombinase family protein [Oliverpabstia sp.]|nr:recombinase family protein [Oliverpabstia sp.]
MAKIIKVEQKMPTIKAKKRVAAYARISMESERMHHSLSAQISYYNALIQKKPEWEFAGVYADDGISGTGIAKRTEFQRMLADCEAGKINIILTKSIQRFARNTVDLLETVRHLKDIGVEVRFEKENINSMSGDGELMLSILASFAQEESRSISENVKWGTKKRFEQGIPNGHFQIYGYRWEGDHLVVEPKEAKIVKLIFDNFMNGLSAESTEKQLEEMGVKSYKGVHFSNSSIRQILSNVTYTGNLLFQKEYVSDPITGKSKKNNGEMPQYWVENTHEAIIPMEIFQAVQKERQRRRELGVLANWSINTSCFTSKIKCPICGKSYRRSGKRQRKDSNEVYYIWICRTKSEKGAKFCDAKSIPEKKLKAVCAEALGLNEFDETQFSERVRQITVIGDDTLEFYFTDGTVIQKKWKSTAKTDWWTEERKKEWGERHKNKFRNPNRAFYNEFTGFIKCGNCGENYRSQGKTYADGTKDRYWRCSESCGNTAIKHSTVQALVCDVLGIKKFSEEQMDAVIEKAVVSNGLVTFCFKDGHTESREYEEKKKGIPHTEEYKRYMSQVTKERWTPEAREEMSKRVKELRKERGKTWRKEK